jgi:hypothetical protein
LANINWVSATGGLWSVGGNWNGGIVPSTNDIAVFSTVYGSGNITIDQNVVCSGIIVSGNYNGNMTAAGYGYYLYGDYVDDGTGTRTLGSGIILNGASSTLHLGSTLGTVTATSCTLTMNTATSGVIDVDKATTFMSIVIGASAIATSSGAAKITYQSATTLLTIGANATYTVNFQTDYKATAAQQLWSLGAGCTWNGTGRQDWVGSTNNAVPANCSIPATSYTGTGIFLIRPGNPFEINGNISYGGALYLVDGIAAAFTVNTNNYNITCGAFNLGGGNATSVYNFGSSAITCTSLAPPTSVNAILNMSTSTWTCSGNWTFGSNQIVDPGTSTVNITNTSTITSASKSFYNLNLNAPGKIITIADDINLAIGGGFALTAGTVSTGTTYCIFAGNGSITLGADLSWRLRTAINSSTITWNTGTNIWTIPAYTLNDWGGTTSTVSWISSSPGSQYKISAPAGIAVNYMNVTDCNNIGIDIDALAVTNVNGGNNLNWLFYVAPPATSGTAQVTGMRFYNPLLHKEYFKQNRRVLNAVKRYIGG